MTRTEKKIVYSILIVVMSLIFSGYTIRNAEYMRLADSYIDDFESLKRDVRYSVELGEIDKVRAELEKKRSSFMKELQSSYSSKVSDRLMLKISFNKFDAQYNKISEFLNQRTIEIAPEKNKRMVSISLNKEESVKEKDVELEKKVVEKKDEEERRLITIWKRVSFKALDDIPENTVVFDEDEITYLKAFKVEEGKEAERGNELKDILERHNLSFDPNIKVNTFYEGKDLQLGKNTYKYKNGKYVTNILNKEVEFDSVVVRLESHELPGFGKALIYNGREFLTGAWMMDDDGVDYFDNRGNLLSLSQGRTLITKAQAEEVNL